MDRGASAGVLTEIARAANRPFHLVSVEFGDGGASTVYMTDAWQNIVWSGETWLALGQLLGFTDIEETGDLQINSLTLTLSGVEQSLVAAFFAYDYLDRAVKIYKGFLDADMAVVADPILIFEGRMDSPVVDEDPEKGTCTIAATATNAWVDFERRAGRHTNHEEQQVFFPGDQGFQFASEVVKDVIWGRK